MGEEINWPDDIVSRALLRDGSGKRDRERFGLRRWSSALAAAVSKSPDIEAGDRVIS